MSESYSTQEFMNTLPKNNFLERLNASPTGLTVEQIEGYGRAFIPELIARKREKYTNRIDRHEVVCSDAMATFVCERYIEEITAKPFKSYDEDEELGKVEVMIDLWERIEQLDMGEIYRAIYPKWSGDGYCLTHLYITPSMTPGYKAYGYFESPPDYWKRYSMKGTPYHNIIYEYYVQYIPIPNGYQYMGNYNIHAEEQFLYPDMDGFFHFNRKVWNHGVGKPRLQGIWASLTKLRKMSYADYRRALVFNIFEYPEDMNLEDVVEPMIEAIKRADEVEGVAVPMRVNPITQQVEEFPRFRERTWDEAGGAPRSDPSAGGSLLRHSEYARVLISLGYTETKLVGSQPGEVTGSKLDLTRDDQVDVREFKLFSNVIKKINIWLLEHGFLEGLEDETLQRVFTKDYDVICHTEWEVIDNMLAAAEMAEEEAEMDAENQTRMNSAEYKMNALAHNLMVYCIRNNVNSPGMIPVQSSWIEQMGVKDKRLWFKFKGWPGYAGYEFGSNDEAYQAYLSAADGSTTKWGQSGSTGAWIWENIWAGGGKGPRPTVPGVNDNVTGIRYSTDPFTDTPYQDRGLGDPATKREELTKGIGVLGGTHGTGAPMTYQPSKPWGSTTSTGPFDFAPSGPSVATPGYVADPKSITGSKKTGPGPKRKRGKSKTRQKIVPYNLTTPSAGVPPIRNASFARANELMKSVRGKGFSKTTWIDIRKMIDKWDQENLYRINSLDIGNPMNFDIKLLYEADNNKGYTEEYICKKEWKKINNHQGDLKLYPDLGHQGKFVVVGSYKYKWNNKTDMPEIVRKIDDDLLKSTLEKWNKTSSVIYDKLNKGIPQRMSTEYFCSLIKHNKKTYQVGFHDGHGSPYLKGIAIVEYGNCQEPFCNFENIDEEEKT